MSRVTKLRKRNYAQTHGPHSRHVRRILNHNRSQKLRAAQKQRPHRCTCGHYDHGEYGCFQGCPWGLCQPELNWTPILGDLHFSDRFEDFYSNLLNALRVDLDPKTMTLKDGTRVLLLGDMAHGFESLDIRDRPVVK